MQQTQNFFIWNSLLLTTQSVCPNSSKRRIKPTILFQFLFEKEDFTDKHILGQEASTYFSWFSVTFSHCIKLSRASCTPWLWTSAVSRARHLSASASDSWLYFSSSSTTGVSKAAFSAGVCWPSRDLKRAATLCRKCVHSRLKCYSM